MATTEEVARAIKIAHDNARELMSIWLAATDEQAQLEAMKERFGLTDVQARVVASMESRHFSEEERVRNESLLEKFDS